MEFRQIRYFVAVAEEGNIGRAARRLNVSQPPISRQIQALEYRLGAPLLIRTAKGVSLTDAGKIFLEEAKKILAQADRSIDRFQSANRGEIGRLDVAFFGSVIYNSVPNALRAFRKNIPEAEVSLSRLGKAAQIEALQEGRIHVGFGRYYSDTPGISIEKLGDEAVFVAVSKETRIPPHATLKFSDILDLPLVLFPRGGRPSYADLVVGAFRNAGIEPKVSTIAEDITSALAITGLGNACCIVPAAVASLSLPSLKFLPFDEATVRPPINCVYRTHNRPPVLKAFLETLAKSSITGVT